jgi:16S rRNA (cytosine1402-N4)-methyltransferase
MSAETPPPKTSTHTRRKRYRGTHPRAFEEKYKELDSQNFATDVEKVIARGQTPAGTHRPICVDEILAILNPQPGETVLDCTLGFGGHTQSLLPRLVPGGKLFAIDVDSVERPRTEARLRKLGFGEDALNIRELNFADIAKLIPDTGGFDCILADLGVSSMQLDNPTRGFSFKNDGPLDLRLNPLAGEPASALLQSMSAYDLGQLFATSADEPHAARIAYGIKRNKTPITTTQQLAENIRATLKDFPEKNDHKKTLARTFMALRIAVNNEFDVLDRFLASLPACMKPGGRVAILSFHSGEDRRIEQAFQQSASVGIFSSIAVEAIRPSPEEQRSNPRSSSARLRWAVRSSVPVS